MINTFPDLIKINFSSKELQDHRSLLNQGWIGLFAVLITSALFTCLFHQGIPHNFTLGKLFVWSPALAGGIAAMYVLYILFNIYRDIKSGYKISVNGKISRMYVKSRLSTLSPTIFKLPIPMRHLIVVDGRSYLVKSFEYDQCNIGSPVKLYVTPFGKKVMDFEIISAKHYK